MKSIDALRNKVQDEAPEPMGGADLEEYLSEEIDNFLLGRNETKWKQSYGFAPSQNNACLRYLGYRLRGYEHTDSFAAQTLRIFDQGHDVESRLISYLDEMGLVVDSQVEFKHESPPIHAFVDIVVNINGEEMPIEVKSINQNGFDWKEKLKKPSDEHYRQLQVYLDIGNWDRGLIFYVNKNTNAHKIFLVEKNQGFIDKLYKKWNKVYDAHQRGVLSIRPYKKTSKNCQNCSAFEHCWNDPEEGVKLA